jgi:hypothetical protein
MTGDRVIERFRGKLSHATRRIPDVTDAKNVAQCYALRNRSRLAKLQVLYSLLQGNDHQVLVGKSPPHEVWSVDHGLFLPGGQAWSAATLASQADKVSLDPWFTAAALTPAELKTAAVDLEKLTDEVIGQITAEVPSEWNSIPADLEGLRTFLVQRRTLLNDLIQKS